VTAPTHEPAACRVARAPSFVALALILGCFGCASGLRGDAYVPPFQPVWRPQKLPSYRVGLPGPAWEVMRDKGLQVAWRHSTDSSVIQVYGECEQHGDSDLEDFTDHQRIDYSAWKIVEEPTGDLDAKGRPRMRRMQYYTTIAEREALRTTVRANLDGVDIMIEYVVLKKDGCLFDLTYIARPQTFDQHVGDFQRVIDGFAYPVRR
jgi:hypothetical protein